MARLPPFFALRALEAAARHRSYSRAGDELSVTHGAVSQQIRRLEAELGARLFERVGNAMIPTPEAQGLAQEIGRAIKAMERAVDVFTAAADHAPLVISLDPQFASRWLPTRLPRLLSHPAGVNLEIRVDQGLANFTTDGVDMGVRYGRGAWEGLETRRLYGETLIPVLSPELQRQLCLSTPACLLDVPLVHHRHRPWSLWFEAQGLEPPEAKGVVFEDSLLTIEAAIQGVGVALARSGLIEQDLRTGRLVKPFEGVASELGMWVVWRADSRKLRRIEALRDWLCEEARAAADAEETEAA